MTAQWKRELEIAEGRRITELRKKQTEQGREALAKRQQEERDADEARRQEIMAIGRGYEQALAPPQEARPLEPPTEEEVRQAVSRRSAKVKT